MTVKREPGSWHIRAVVDPVNLTRNAAIDGRPDPLPGTASFAFDSNRAGNFEIYTMGSDLEMTSVAVSRGFAYGVGDIDDRVALARFTLGPPLLIDVSYADGGLAFGPPLELDQYGPSTAYAANDLAVHPVSGKVTVVGGKYDCAGGDCSSFYYGFAMRFLRGGALDASFGIGGEARAGCTDDSIIGNTSVALQGAKAILAGVSNDKWEDYTDRFGVTRLTPSGEWDASFDRGACTTYGTEDSVAADVVFTGTSIVVAGGRFTARYLAT